MSNVTVREFAKAWSSQIYNRIIGATVYLDDATSECLHWNGGLLNMVTSGAVAVKSLSPFESCRKSKKAVFVSQTTSTQLHTIQEIIRNSDLTHCILISCVSLDVVYLELNDGEDVGDMVSTGKGPLEATKKLKAMLREWIGKEESEVEVVYIPIFTISPTNSIFLTPPYHNMYPMSNGQLISQTSLYLDKLPVDERSQIRRLASALNCMLSSMNYREDVYYIGAYSSLLAEVLENSPVCSARRRSCTYTASLILIDRTIDLCGATSFGMTSVLDKIMSVLPRLPGHTTDVAVDMSAICEANVISHPDDVQLSPGCLYHANDNSCIQNFEHMINKSQKEVMIELYNKLAKLDNQKSSAGKSLLKVTPQSIEKIVTSCKGNYDVILENLGILQQSLGVLQMLKSPKRSELELLTILEGQVVQNLAVSRDSTSVLKQISNLIQTRKNRDLCLEGLLALLVHVYSLAGTEVTFPKEHEDNLNDTLCDAIYEDHERLYAGTDRKIEVPEDCEEISLNIMSRLKDIALMRKNLQKYSSVIKPGKEESKEQYRGVLQQLVDDMVELDKPDLPDLKYKQEGLKEILLSSLNRISMSKRPPTKHPMDHPTVVIFVVGGITSEECRQLLCSVMTSGADSDVIIGSTKFVTPEDAMKDVLVL